MYKVTVSKPHAAAFGCVLLLVAFAGYSLLITLPIMWLWNWTMPGLFGLPQIGWWTTLKLVLMARLLTGSISIKPREDR